MSNSTEQNGRQPTPKTTPPTDPRIKNVPAPNVCRDFIWGICFKGAQCKHPHKRDFESMKETLKFCHDFQNKTGCIRPDCTYLHATREEHNLFLTTGQIPRALTERYAAMSNPVNTISEGMAHQNMAYLGEFLHQPPPPPPVTIAPPVTAAVQPHMVRPPLPPLPSLLAPPPPPPPPTETTTLPRITPPKYTSSSQSTPAIKVCPLNQPPLPLPANFDASKPPPPLPPHPNGAQKRHADPCEAGPSKARKADSCKGIDLCDSCVQRKLRFELYRQEIQKLQYEKEYKTILYEKKLEDYENGRLLLRTIVNPELYQILDEYVERPAASIPAQDILSQLGHSFGLGHSSVTTDDTILLSLSAPSRTRSTISNTSPDLLQTVLELFRTTTSTSGSDRSPMSESRVGDHLSIEPRPSTSSLANSAVNGLHSLMNGQRMERPAHEVVVPRFPTAPPVPPAPPAPPSSTASAVPGSYMPYQPAVPPPPVRPFYAQPYPSTSNTMPNTNPAFNPSVRMGVPQTSARPNMPVTVTNTTTMQNFNQYMLGQFPPQPPYYPPYQ